MIQDGPDDREALTREAREHERGLMSLVVWVLILPVLALVGLAVYMVLRPALAAILAALP